MKFRAFLTVAFVHWQNIILFVSLANWSNIALKFFFIDFSTALPTLCSAVSISLNTGNEKAFATELVILRRLTESVFIFYTKQIIVSSSSVLQFWEVAYFLTVLSF